MEGGWFDTEAIEQERFDADLEMAELEAQGRAYSLRQHQSELLRREGNLVAAAGKCPHGSGFPLDSLAASEGTTGFGIDPNAGEEGWRCCDCGSRLDTSPWDGGIVTVPCEVGV